jgi:hypothetical protein
VILEPSHLFLYPEYETGGERRIDLTHETNLTSDCSSVCDQAHSEIVMNHPVRGSELGRHAEGQRQKLEKVRPEGQQSQVPPDKN